MTTPRVLNGKEPHVRTSLERVCHSKEAAAQEWSNFFALSCILFVWKPSNSDHHLHLIRLVLYFRTSKMTFQCVFQNQVTPMFFAIIANVAIAHLSLWTRMIYESMTCFWVGARAAVCQTIGWQCDHLSSLCSSSQLDHYQSEFQDTWIPPSMSSYHPLSTPAFCSTFFYISLSSATFYKIFDLVNTSSIRCSGLSSWMLAGCCGW